jgi:hypothetical protein
MAAQAPAQVAVPVTLTDGAKITKLTPYLTNLNNNIINKIGALTDQTFDDDFKKLPLIVDYSPRVGGKSRHKNNKNNKKNNKSRRRNQSKRQRK